MAYKQKNPLTGGISYGPMKGNKPPVNAYSNPKGTGADYTVVSDAIKNVGTNQTVSSADGSEDENTQVETTVKQDIKAGSDADLKKALEQNRKEGNLQPDIIRTKEKANDLSLSPRKRAMSEQKLNKKKGKYKVEQAYQDLLKEMRDEKTEGKINKFRERKYEKLKRKTKDFNKVRELDPSSYAPEKPELPKQEGISKEDMIKGIKLDNVPIDDSKPIIDNIDYIEDNKLYRPGKQTLQLGSFDDPDSPIGMPKVTSLLDNKGIFSDDVKKTTQIFDARIPDEKFKASDAGYWENKLNPNKGQTNKYQPQMNLKHVKRKGGMFPQLDSPSMVNPNMPMVNKGRPLNSNMLNNPGNTPIDPRFMSNQQFRNERMMSDIASSAGTPHDTAFTPNDPNGGIDTTFPQRQVAMYGNHAHTKVTKKNYKDAEKDDAAHMSYLKRDVEDVQHSDMSQREKDKYETEDEKHISKLAGDLRYDHKKFGGYDNVAMYGPSANLYQGKVQEGLDKGMSKEQAKSYAESEMPAMSHGPHYGKPTANLPKSDKTRVNMPTGFKSNEQLKEEGDVQEHINLAKSSMSDYAGYRSGDARSQEQVSQGIKKAMSKGPSKLNMGVEAPRPLTNQQHRDAGHMYNYNTRQWVNKDGSQIGMFEGNKSLKQVSHGMSTGGVKTVNPSSKTLVEKNRPEYPTQGEKVVTGSNTLTRVTKPAMYDGPSSFKAVASKIAKKQGISKKRASAILASSTRKASDEAKRKNPKLKKVKGKPKK